MARIGAGGGRVLVALPLALVLVACEENEAPRQSLREIVEELSEEGGYFDTDNLISNETAYVQVVSALEPQGGVYVGVGPEQNFHYIGRLRPKWAFIVDVRRDNLLHVLMLSAILGRGETPYRYLCVLFSRRCEGAEADASFDEMVAALERYPPDGELFEENLEALLEHIEKRLDFPLGREDRKAIGLIYRAFFEEQLALRFKSHGRPPMPHHPTYRSLLVARDEAGSPAHFLSRPDDYDYVRGLARDGRLVPVVGDFAGPHALRAVGDFARERGETVSAFYVSNVEFYLMRSGAFRSYVENVRSLPISETSELIRAYFSYGYPHPAAIAGHRSTLVRQKVGRFLELYDAGVYADYWDLATVDYER